MLDGVLGAPDSINGTDPVQRRLLEFTADRWSRRGCDSRIRRFGVGYPYRRWDVSELVESLCGAGMAVNIRGIVSQCAQREGVFVIVERRSLLRSPKTLSRFEIGGISGFPNIYPGRNASVRLLRRSSDYAINRQLATNREKRYRQVVVSYEAKLGNCAKLS
jgi:hypothetical protein